MNCGGLSLTSRTVTVRVVLDDRGGLPLSVAATWREKNKDTVFLGCPIELMS